MSEKSQRAEILATLQTMSDYVSAAEGLLEQDGDQCMGVLKLLEEARRAGSQGVVALMGACLEEKLGVVQAGLGDSTAGEIDQLIKLTNFSLLNLCLPCREEVGRSLTETKPESAAAQSSAAPQR